MDRSKRNDDLRLAHEESVETLAAYLEGLRPKLISGVRRAYPQLEDAVEDVIQNAFVGLLAQEARGFRLYQGLASLETYVTGIVRRRAFDLLTLLSTKTTDSLSEYEESAASSPSDNPDALVERTVAGEEIRRAVAGLPERQRLAIELYYFAGQDCHQVGEVLDCSAKRVSSLLVEARAGLRRRLSGPG
jgi:RNA polymerase sigma-70 factor (ECF subfamily)